MLREADDHAATHRYRRGALSVSLVRAIKEYSTGSLIEAKNVLDRVLDEEDVTLTFSSPERRSTFRGLAEKYGFVVEDSTGAEE